MPGYEEKVPRSVRDDNVEKGVKLDAELASIRAAIADFEKLMREDAA